jgi:dTDP-4-amino-4,6-dideoxygalactose transaminase
MNQITFLDLRPSPTLYSELTNAYRNVLLSGQYILGDCVKAFESAWARYCGTEYCAGVGNGFDALQLILRAYGIGKGDEVIVPSNAPIPVWMAVVVTGATVVPCEPHHRTMNIYRGSMKFTDKTKALILVHLYGNPAVVNRRSIPEHIKIIEDACQAHGASFSDKKCGNMGDAAAFSFYPTKNLGTYGDGGAVTTNDEKLDQKIRELRFYGGRDVGVNSRLDELHAAFLLTKLDSLDEYNKKRFEHAEIYFDRLWGVNGLWLPWITPGVTPCWHQFVIQTHNRDGLKGFLRSKGVETMVHYPNPSHRYGIFKGKYELPISDKLSKRVLSLPIGPHLENNDIEYVADKIVEFFK